WLLLRDPRDLRARRAARPETDRRRSLLRCSAARRAGGRRGGGAPGVAAAPARRQSARLRAGLVLYAQEPAPPAHPREAVCGLRPVRRGTLEVPRPIHRRVVARVVRRLGPLGALARVPQERLNKRLQGGKTMDFSVLANSLQSTLGGQLPAIFGALAIIAVGWLVAGVARARS